MFKLLFFGGTNTFDLSHTLSLSLFFSPSFKFLFSSTVLLNNLNSTILSVIIKYKLSLKQYSEIPIGFLPKLMYTYLRKILLNSVSNSQVPCQWLHCPATRTNLSQRHHPVKFFRTTNATTREK